MNFREVYNRDRQLILNIPLKQIQRYLAFATIFFSILNFLDVATTLFNLNYIEGAFEVNVFLGSLFYSGPLGILAAVLVKIEIVVILILIYFISPNDKFRLTIKVIKIGTLAGLCAAIPLYVWGVLINNLYILIQSLILL